MGRRRKTNTYCVAVDDAIENTVGAAIVEGVSRKDALEYQRKILGYGDVVKRRSVLHWGLGNRPDREEIETSDGHRIAAWIAPDVARERAPDSELTARAKAVLARLSLAQDVVLVRVVERKGCFVRGADVMASRRLEALGLVVVTDNGSMRGIDGRSDGERWYVELADADLGREVVRLLAEGGVVTTHSPDCRGCGLCERQPTSGQGDASDSDSTARAETVLAELDEAERDAIDDLATGRRSRIVEGEQLSASSCRRLARLFVFVRAEGMGGKAYILDGLGREIGNLLADQGDAKAGAK